jgi:hypothetical protein
MDGDRRQFWRSATLEKPARAQEMGAIVVCLFV